MKNLLILLIIIVTASCKSTYEPKAMLTDESCPDGGTCTVTKLPNRSYTLKEDEYSNSYIEFYKTQDKEVWKYEYTRDKIEGVVDDEYREIVMIEIDKNLEALRFKDNGLFKVNAVYGLVCNCRGAAGYYPIRKGTLDITRNDVDGRKEWIMTLDVPDVPRLTKAFKSYVDFK